MIVLACRMLSPSTALRSRREAPGPGGELSYASIRPDSGRLGLMAAVPATAPPPASRSASPPPRSRPRPRSCGRTRRRRPDDPRVARTRRFGRPGEDQTRRSQVARQHRAVEGHGAEAGYDVLLPLAAGHEDERDRHVQDGAGGHLRRADELLLDRRRRRPAARGPRKPFYNNFQVYKRQQSERNDFNINLGDTIYSDTEVGTTNAQGVFTPAAPTAKTVAPSGPSTARTSRWPTCQRCAGRAAMYNHWDDHEFINDFTKAENGSAIYNAGRDGVPRLHAGHATRAEGHLPVLPLGQEPRGVHARRALVPQGKGEREPPVRRPATAPRPRADRPAVGADTFAAIYPALSRPAGARRASRRSTTRAARCSAARQFTRFTNAVKARRRPSR